MPKQESVVPIGVESVQALHALTRKYAEVAGRLGLARQNVQALMGDLTHIEAAIRIFDPSIDVGRIRAKHIPVQEPAAKGEVTGILLDVLRESDEPLTPRELTEHLMIRRGLAMEDRDLFLIILKRVRACLRSQRNQGVLRPVGMDGAAQLWEVIQ